VSNPPATTAHQHVLFLAFIFHSVTPLSVCFLLEHGGNYEGEEQQQSACEDSTINSNSNININSNSSDEDG
jgi:hypothetical protein